jgi:hypothetical protein
MESNETRQGKTSADAKGSFRKRSKRRKTE